MNRCFTEKEIDMTNKLMERYLASLSNLRNEYPRPQ